jgi:hypothetical protein
MLRAKISHYDNSESTQTLALPAKAKAKQSTPSIKWKALEEGVHELGTNAIYLAQYLPNEMILGFHIITLLLNLLYMVYCKI